MRGQLAPLLLISHFNLVARLRNLFDNDTALLDLPARESAPAEREVHGAIVWVGIVNRLKQRHRIRVASQAKIAIGKKIERLPVLWVLRAQVFELHRSLSKSACLYQANARSRSTIGLSGARFSASSYWATASL